jgi:hypothetical protein
MQHRSLVILESIWKFLEEARRRWIIVLDRLATAPADGRGNQSRLSARSKTSSSFSSRDKRAGRFYFEKEVSANSRAGSKREGKMQAVHKLILVVFAVTIGGLLAPAAAQQSAKSGTLAGKWGGQSTGQAYELDKGHVFLLGVFSPVFFNDVPGGFLDRSAWTCPLVSDSVNGVHVADHGYCIATDKDGDKAFAVFQSKGSAPGSGAGTGQFTGGTGKFSGLQGQYPFRFTLIGNTPGSWVVTEGGEWRLP